MTCQAAESAQASVHTALTRVDRIRQTLLNPSDPAILIVAHRTRPTVASENSVHAIQACAESNIHVVEIDLRRTSDGHYVLMHDPDVDRTTTGTGKVSEMTLAQLKQLHLIYGLSPTHERVPTYHEVLAAARDRVMLNIDLKEGSLQEVINIARSEGMLGHCLFKGTWSKISQEELVWLNKQSDVMFMPIIHSLQEAEQAVDTGHFCAFEVLIKSEDSPLYDRAALMSLKQRGIRIWINSLWEGRYSAGLGDYTAIEDPDSVFPQLVELGAGIIQTDLPDLTAKTLKEHGYSVP